MTWRFAVEEFGLQTDWDNKAGFSIKSLEQVRYLRSLKITTNGGQLTLGARIFNLQVEVVIHKLNLESQDDFRSRISELRFPENSP